MTMIVRALQGLPRLNRMFSSAQYYRSGGLCHGNLDPELREFFSKAVQTLIPFFAFALGNTIDLTVIAPDWFAGDPVGCGSNYRDRYSVDYRR